MAETPYDANWRAYKAADVLAEIFNRDARDITQDAAELATLANEIEALAARVAQTLQSISYADVVRSAAA